MALLQNIGASNKDDAFYRYKMPVLRTRVESRGNGIATRIENMADIARALARPAPSITKYFRHKLGATSVFDDRTGTCLVHGAHGTAQLAGLLDTFITKYVQCYGCGNPETEIVLVPSSASSSGTATTTTAAAGQKKKKKMVVAVVVSLNCTACGFVSRVGMEDKIFTTKDLQQPSDLLLDKKKGGRRKDKKLQRAAEKEDQGVAAEDGKHKKDAKKKKGGTSKQGVPTATAGGGQLLSSPITHHDQLAGTSIFFGADDADEDDDDDDVQWQTDTSLEAQMKRMQEQLTAGLVMLSSTDEPPEEE